jgi:hypothetical protein
MEMWQRLESLKTSWGFVVLGRVTRNNGKVTGVPSGDRRAVDICLTLTTSNLRSTSPSVMSSAGVFIGRWRITAVICFLISERRGNRRGFGNQWTFTA